MEYDIREFEILHELEGETKIFEDKYPREVRESAEEMMRQIKASTK